MSCISRLFQNVFRAVDEHVKIKMDPAKLYPENVDKCIESKVTVIKNICHYERIEGERKRDDCVMFGWHEAGYILG